MIAIGAKKLLQLIIGAGQIGNVIAMKQAWPVAAADLQKVPHGGCEGPGFGCMLPHGPEQSLEPLLHRSPWLLGVIGQNVRGAMDPAISHPHLRPQRRRRIQPTPQDRLQAPEGLSECPPCAVRSRHRVMAVRRSWSWRPAAAKAWRPSSVRALQTALQ